MNFNGLPDIVGKTITGVIYKSGDGVPGSQLFLVLSDGSWFEFYSLTGERIIPSHSSYPGGLDRARQYMQPDMKTLYEAYLDGDQIVVHNFES